MTQTTFTDNVVVQGSQDTTQLKVQGHNTQTNPLQTWQDSATTPLAKVAKDGRLQTGDMNLGTPDALVEANASITLPSSRPQRGIQSLGRITGALTSAVAWAVHELELLGTGGISALQTAIRAKLTNSNTGASTSAQLRAGDFEARNTTGTSGTRVGSAVGMRGTASNATNAYLTRAAGIESTVVNDASGNITDAAAFEVIAPTNSGTITNLYGLRIPNLTQGTNNYAIHTSSGVAYLGGGLRIPTNAGTGKLLTSDVSGNALWQPPFVDNGICQGRLTLVSGNPVADVTSASTVYFTPYMGNRVTLYDGSSWTLMTFTERSLSLSGLTANTNYDIFLYNNAGTLTLETTAWSNATTRATGLVLQDGVYVRSGATTRRYLGTLRTGATAGQSMDTDRARFVWNFYNQTDRVLVREDATSHTYTTAVWRPWNNTSLPIEMVLGLPDIAELYISTDTFSSSNGTATWTGLQLDSSIVVSVLNSQATGMRMSQSRPIPVGIGYRTVIPMEYHAGGTGTYAYAQWNAIFRG
jgi:hypothetical protein